jgi:hypothetical protein
MALSTLSAAAFAQGWWAVGIPLALLAGTVRETCPIWIAAWTLNPLALIGLLAPIARWIVVVPATTDPVTEQHAVLRHVRDHPVVSALEHHRGHWRSGWLLIAPFGACLAGLISPSLAVIVTLVLAFAQLLVATDLQRLLQTACGPILALSAVAVIPDRFLLLVVVLHAVWWRDPVTL